MNDFEHVYIPSWARLREEAGCLALKEDSQWRYFCALFCFWLLFLFLILFFSSSSSSFAIIHCCLVSVL